MKTKIFACFMLAFSGLLLSNVVNAQPRTESTAKAKEFDISNMTYLGDQDNPNYKMYTDNYVYGYVSSWNSVYKTVVQETNNVTCYIVVFAECSVQAAGEIHSRTFRNKRLEFDVEVESASTINLVNYYPSSSSSVTTISRSFGTTAGIDENGAGLQASFSFEKTQQYSSVTTTIYTADENNPNMTKYVYDFLNYTDGELVAPNVGCVRQRMAFVYQIPHYTGNEKFNFTFRTQANIYKESPSYLPDGELTGQIKCKFDGDQYYGISESLI